MCASGCFVCLCLNKEKNGKKKNRDLKKKTKKKEKRRIKQKTNSTR
jgi:hypothetical protein